MRKQNPSRRVTLANVAIFEQTIDENKWFIEMDSSSEFAADGAYVSKGLSRIHITAAETQAVVKINFDMTTTGRWVFPIFLTGSSGRKGASIPRPKRGGWPFCFPDCGTNPSMGKTG